jgi:hypothetical protein
MTIVTVPDGPPEALCLIALVTSSDVSNVAASESTLPPLPAAASVRVTKARVRRTSCGLPGIVSEPRTAFRRLGAGRGRLLTGVSICACLPI